jgi:hypothetical protein
MDGRWAPRHAKFLGYLMTRAIYDSGESLSNEALATFLTKR